MNHINLIVHIYYLGFDRHFLLLQVFREVFHVGGIQPYSAINELNNQTNGQQTTGFNHTNVHNSMFNGNSDLNVLPLYLRSAVDQLTNMFPQFPRSVIIAELLATGVPDLAAENLMARPSPITPTSSSSNMIPTTSAIVNQNVSHIMMHVRFFSCENAVLYCLTIFYMFGFFIVSTFSNYDRLKIHS